MFLEKVLNFISFKDLLTTYFLFLHRAAKFTNNVRDLKQIYMLQIRSKLEQSAVVWHSSLTRKNISDLERVQKSALKLILKE